MKSFLRVLLLVGLLFPTLFVLNAHAQEDIATEHISLFKSIIIQEENTDIRIREEIHYFFPNPKRGIIREIPTDYKVQAGFRRPTTLVLNEVYYFKEDQPDRRFSQFERTTRSGYTIFKIGDPDVTIQGTYIYIIDYTLKNAVNYFEDYDEFYLNVVGYGWEVPIKNAVTRINTPGEITEKVCFTGPQGSTESDCTFEDVSENEVAVSVNSPLDRFESFTVVLKMPKGTLEDTTGRQRIAFLLSNVGILLPIPFFFLILGVLKKKGKNKKITIIPHYEPMKGIYPLLAGYIHRARLDNKHITAEIIQLALDGHIKIRQEKRKTYILEKDNIEKEIKEDLPRSIYSGLFKGKDSVSTKNFPSDFYLTVRSLILKLSNEVYDNDYFDKKRKKLKGNWITIGIAGIILSFFAMAPLSNMAATGWFLGLLFSSILLLIFSSRVDLRAQKGNEIYHELEGLKMYINTAEKHRIEFHNDPEKFRGVFETLLPYAVIFGLEKKWANEFKDIYKEPPSWYEGDVSAFNAYILASSISG
jgi:hypothetical protein